MLRVRRDKYPLLIAAVGAVLPTLGFAQTSNWTYNAGGAGNWTQSWNDVTNWNPRTSFPNGTTAVALFQTPSVLAAGSGTVQINTAITINKITVAPVGSSSLNNAYNFTGTGSLLIVNGGTIDISPAAAGTLNTTTFSNSIVSPNNSVINKVGTGVAVLTGNNNFGNGGGVNGLNVSGGTIVLSGANAANGLSIITTTNDGVVEMNNNTVTAIGGLGSTVPGANGMVHAMGTNTWNGNFFITAKNGSIGVDTGATLTVNGGVVFDGTDTNVNGFAKVGGDGTLVLNAVNLQGPLSVGGGRLKIKAGASAVSAAGASTTSSITVSGTGLLDLTNNKLTVHYGTALDPSPAATIRGYILAGRNGGNWLGATGITSSSAATDTTHLAVGYSDNLTGDVSIQYTRQGDANLSGITDFSDLLRVAQNYNAPTGKVWSQGDFNYDGAVNFSDLLIVAQNYNAAAPPAVALTSLGSEFVSDWNAANALVPEPGTFGVVSLGIVSYLSSRRRRKN